LAETFYSRDALGNPVKTTDPDVAGQTIAIGNKPIGKEEAEASAAAARNLARADKMGPLGTAALGVGSGLTLGLGPGLLAKAGLVDPGLLSAAEASPLYTVGDVVGTALPAIFSGGDSLLARTPAGMMTGAGNLAERLAGGILGESSGLMGRLASAPIKMAARGIPEGALINMGHTVGESLIQDHPLSAESIAASGLDGALFGGLAGAGLGTVSALGEAAAAGLNTLGKRVSVGSRGIGAIGKSLGIDDLGASTEDATNNAVRYGRTLEKGGSGMGDSTQGKLRGTEKAETIYKETRSNAVDELEQMAPDQAPSPERIKARLDETVVGPREGTAQKSAAAKEVKSFWEGFTNEEPLGRPEWNDKNDFQTYAQWKESGHGEGLKGDAKRAAYDEYKAAKDIEFNKYSSEFKSSKASEYFPDNWKGLIEARDRLAKEISPDRANPLFADKNTIKSEILNAVDDEITQAMQVADERLPGITEKYAGATQGLKTTDELKAALGKKATDQLMSTGHGLNTHDFSSFGFSAALGHPVGAATIMGAKLIGRRIHGLAEPWLADMAYKQMIGTKAAGARLNVQGRVAKAIGNFFKNTTRIPYKAAQVIRAESSNSKPMDRTGYEEFANKMENLTSDEHQRKVAAYVDSVAKQGFPELAQELYGTNARAVNYIVHNMPARKGSKNLTSLRPVPVSKVLDMTEHKFGRIGKGIIGPLSLVDKLESGQISRDEVRAAAYVYPKIWGPGGMVAQEVAEKVMEMKSKGESLPMDKVYALGAALNSPIDSTLQPEFINAVQASLAQPPPGGQSNQQAGNMQGNPAGGPINTQNLLTPTQKALA
jgi:hypothetical protein